MRPLPTLRTGLRWTAQNDRDMALLGSLLGVEVEASDTIPAYDAPPVVSDRQTIVLDREDSQWANFEQWRQGKIEQERYEDAPRMMRR